MKTRLRRALRWPAVFCCWCLFGLVVPWILYAMDRLDSAKTATLGYACRARGLEERC